MYLRLCYRTLYDDEDDESLAAYKATAQEAQRLFGVDEEEGGLSCWEPGGSVQSQPQGKPVECCLQQRYHRDLTRIEMF